MGRTAYGSLQRTGRLHELLGHLVEAGEQRVAIEPEDHRHQPVDACVAVASEVVTSDGLEVRGHRHLDLAASPAPIGKEAVDGGKGGRHLVGRAVEPVPALPEPSDTT